MSIRKVNVVKSYSCARLYLPIALISSCLAASTAWGDTHEPGGNAAKEVVFLLKLPQYPTLADVKDDLPEGTHLSDATWTCPFETYCNVVHFSGAITGIIELQSAQQKQYEDKPKPPESIARARESDPVLKLYVFMDDGVSKAGANLTRLNALTDVLGKPTEEETDKAYGQVSASWKLHDGRTLSFGQEAELVGETNQKPLLYFQH